MATSIERDKRIWPDLNERVAGKPEETLCSNQFSSRATKEDPHIVPIKQDIQGTITKSEEIPFDNQEDAQDTVIDVTSLHIMDISELPLLSHNEEIELSKQIEIGQQSSGQLMATSDPAARARMEREIMDGVEARKKLWESNCRLVVAVARRYIRKGVPFDDLIQEGNLGLDQAINRFDWRRGFRFSTYAHWWIRQSVTRAIANQARTIRVPVHIIEFMAHVFRSAEELHQQNGSEPDAKQVAEYMNVPIKRVTEALQAYRKPMSLELSAGYHENRVISDYIPGSDDTAEMVEKNALTYEVANELLDKLDFRERRILELRYGIADGEEHTLSYIGSEFGVTRERIRQIESETLRKLRAAENNQRLLDYL